MSNQILDPNLEVKQIDDVEHIAFYDVKLPPFAIYGVYYDEQMGLYRRLPEDVAANISKKVQLLSKRTAGGRIRFSTDSDRIVLKASFAVVYRSEIFALTGSAGFDLFVDDPETGASRFYGKFGFAPDFIDGYTSEIVFRSRRLRHITIHFPSYSAITDVQIGLKKDAMIGKGLSYKPSDPIVYYGSSITQGACACRPGNTYENIICRKTCIDYLNFGFSGNARGEIEMAEYLSGLKMSAFVFDYDHNAPDAEHLQKTHEPFFQMIRKAHPDIPIIILSCPDAYHFDNDTLCRRRDIILDTYHHARAAGDKNVYFIDGESIFRGPYEDLCTVDNVHPNDLGFALMADAVYAALQCSSLRRVIG